MRQRVVLHVRESEAFKGTDPMSATSEPRSAAFGRLSRFPTGFRRALWRLRRRLERVGRRALRDPAHRAAVVTYRRWLLAQTHRGDIVGAVARRVDADRAAGCLRAWSFRGIGNHLRDAHGDDGSDPLIGLLRGWFEWRERAL